MTVYCKVDGCRYSALHVTKGHKCEICYEFGHGQIECRNPVMRVMLLRYFNDIIDDVNKCKINNCTYKNCHTTDGHFCNKCNRYISYCSCSIYKHNPFIYPKKININENICLICKNNHQLNNCDLRFKIYEMAYYVRVPTPIEYYQTPPNIEYNKPHDFNCPTCRNNVNYKAGFKIYAVQIKCPICFDTNDSDVTTTPCGHPVCTECYNALAGINKESDNEELDNEELTNEELNNEELNNEELNIIDSRLISRTPYVPPYLNEIECKTRFSDDNILEKARCIFNANYIKGPTFCAISGTMGSLFFLRKQNAVDIIEGFIMTQDNWGQNGEFLYGCDDRPFLAEFINNHKFIGLYK